jgi:hypothetical protein
MRNCRKETEDFFNNLFFRNKIKHISLTIEDLIDMSNVPDNKRISDAELSCLVKARRIGCTTICDDKTAIKYIQNYIVLGNVIGIKKIIIEAYIMEIIGDYDVKNFQKVLNDNRFTIKGDLLYEAATEKYIRNAAAAREDS